MGAQEQSQITLPSTPRHTTYVELGAGHGVQQRGELVLPHFAVIDDTDLQYRAVQHHKVDGHQRLLLLHVISHLAIPRNVRIKLGERRVVAGVLGDKRLLVCLPDLVVLFAPRRNV